MKIKAKLLLYSRMLFLGRSLCKEEIKFMRIKRRIDYLQDIQRLGRDYKILSMRKEEFLSNTMKNLKKDTVKISKFSKRNN